MKEPRYEYHFTQPYYRDWSSAWKGAGTVPFDHWLNMRRDPKEIQQEVVVKKLQKYHPFRSVIPIYPKINRVFSNIFDNPITVGTRKGDGSTRT